MGLPAAKKNDQVIGVDIHMILPPTPSPVPTPVPHPFSGRLDGALSPNVNIMGAPAATVDSTATNSPSHVPIGGTFQKPPSNKGTVDQGSGSVFINGKAVARAGDPVRTCNDPNDAPMSSILATGTVYVG